ncbi:MAG: hypothetical protein JNK17_02235 [Hydrogenophaga sp.]|nr:hypothetical protein [Hydrogenophaga sp.]
MAQGLDFKVTVIGADGSKVVREVRGTAGSDAAIAWVEQLVEARIGEARWASAIRLSPPVREVPPCGL